MKGRKRKKERRERKRKGKKKNLITSQAESELLNYYYENMT